MTSDVGHEVSIVERSNFSNAICTCGWRGPARRSRRLARKDADEHLAQPDSAPPLP